MDPSITCPRLAGVLVIAATATLVAASQATAAVYGPPAYDQWRVFAFSDEPARLDLGRWTDRCNFARDFTGTGAPAAAPGQCRQIVTADPIARAESLLSRPTDCVPSMKAIVLSDKSYPLVTSGDAKNVVAPVEIPPQPAGSSFRICVQNVNESGQYFSPASTFTVQFGPFKLSKPVLKYRRKAYPNKIAVACARRDGQAYYSDLGGSKIVVSVRVGGRTVKSVLKPNSTARPDKPIYEVKSKLIKPGARVSVKCEIYSQVSRDGEGGRFPTKANTTRAFFYSPTTTARLPR